MNCHSQIFANSPFLEPVRDSFETGRPLRWTRVHDLPDFVYFDHSIHVNKGVGCTASVENAAPAFLACRNVASRSSTKNKPA